MIIFNIQDWISVKVITKQHTNKPIISFIIARTLYSENILILANSNGTIFSLDLESKDNKSLIKLEFDKLEHDNPIFTMDYCPETDMICSISKNVIYLVKLKDVKISKKFKNFEFFGSNKPYGIVCNNDFLSKTKVLLLI